MKKFYSLQKNIAFYFLFPILSVIVVCALAAGLVVKLSTSTPVPYPERIFVFLGSFWGIIFFACVPLAFMILCVIYLGILKRNIDPAPKMVKVEKVKKEKQSKPVKAEKVKKEKPAKDDVLKDAVVIQTSDTTAVVKEEAAITTIQTEKKESKKAEKPEQKKEEKPQEPIKEAVATMPSKKEEPKKAATVIKQTEKKEPVKAEKPEKTKEKPGAPVKETATIKQAEKNEPVKEPAAAEISDYQKMRQAFFKKKDQVDE